jgi:hypothetical protein
VDVPAFGFFCTKGDLNRTTGAPLPAGEYEVDWHCGPFAAAPVRFTVIPSDAKPAPLAKRPHLHFYHLTHGAEDEGPERAGEPVRWNECQTESVRAESMTAALAVGQGGTFVPDVHAIPAADKLVEAWAVWKPYRDGDRVCVTLRAVPPYERIRFDELPELFLQIETPDDGDRVRWGERAKAAMRFADRHERLVTPLTIEARLPEEWREWLGASETVRVAVLVASKRIEFPRGNAQVLEKAKERRADRAFGEDRVPVWSGVVRSDFTELRLPPQLPPSTPAP